MDEPAGDKQYEVLEVMRVGLGPRRPEGERINFIAKAFLKVIHNHRVRR